MPQEGTGYFQMKLRDELVWNFHSIQPGIQAVCFGRVNKISETRMQGMIKTGF